MSNPKKPMTTEDAARIQSEYAKKHGGKVPKNHFVGRAQRAAQKNQDK
ncbi:hypothetical protein [Pseudoalteromonas sp. BDTF-M6]|nr:hypothetical protein [Pseudoalteromonas sp. BDTF-M6]MBS3797190.1 hypothetical protein [Pseudoalteromonas sp. BDTF-M6]